MMAAAYCQTNRIMLHNHREGGGNLDPTLATVVAQYQYLERHNNHWLVTNEVPNLEWILQHDHPSFGWKSHFEKCTLLFLAKEILGVTVLTYIEHKKTDHR